MMRLARLFATGLALFVVVGLAIGQEKKEKVVDGKIACTSAN